MVVLLIKRKHKRLALCLITLILSICAPNMQNLLLWYDSLVIHLPPDVAYTTTLSHNPFKWEGNDYVKKVMIFNQRLNSKDCG